MAALEYAAQDLRDHVQLMKLIRRIVASDLRRIVSRDWSEFFYNHTRMGRVTLEGWTDIFTSHVGFHRNLIERNLRLWKAH
jgi:hypothetical protein